MVCTLLRIVFVNVVAAMDVRKSLSSRTYLISEREKERSRGLRSLHRRVDVSRECCLTTRRKSIVKEVASIHVAYSPVFTFDGDSHTVK